MPRQLLHRRPGPVRFQADRTMAGLGEAVDPGAVGAGPLAVAIGAAGDGCLSAWFAGVLP